MASRHYMYGTFNGIQKLYNRPVRKIRLIITINYSLDREPKGRTLIEFAGKEIKYSISTTCQLPFRPLANYYWQAMKSPQFQKLHLVGLIVGSYTVYDCCVWNVAFFITLLLCKRACVKPWFDLSTLAFLGICTLMRCRTHIGLYTHVDNCDMCRHLPTRNWSVGHIYLARPE